MADDPRPALIAALVSGNLAAIVATVRDSGAACVAWDTAEFGRPTDPSAPLRETGPADGEPARAHRLATGDKSDNGTDGAVSEGFDPPIAAPASVMDSGDPATPKMRCAPDSREGTPRAGFGDAAYVDS
jgi:hypothetical protein